MTPSRAVVVPFGVSEEMRGLGVGLAALLHNTLEYQGGALSLAQLYSQVEGAPAGTPARAVEACIPPESWRDVQRNSGGGPELEFVVTGSLEEPTECAGSLVIHSFDPRDGNRFDIEETSLELADAGSAMVALCTRALAARGFDTSALASLSGASWEAIESLLRAERLLVRDPTRQQLRDSVAALTHLRRALSECTSSAYIRARLAQIAVELATQGASKEPEIAAARRALKGALADAPDSTELIEAQATLDLKHGAAAAALAHLLQAIESGYQTPRIHALVAEAQRQAGALEAALSAIELGLVAYPGDGLLRTEKGTTLRELGLLDSAAELLRGVLEDHPGHPAPYLQLAAIAESKADKAQASALVDHALAANAASPLVLRAAINLAQHTEPEGVARASRIAQLATTLSRQVPGDPWPQLMLARAEAQLGEGEKAMRALARVRNLAPESAFAAEALRGEFAVQQPAASEIVDQLLVDVQSAELAKLPRILASATALSVQHTLWTCWFARGLAEHRLGRRESAKTSLEQAIEHARGATPAWLELGAVLIGLGKGEAALKVAVHARALEGDSPQSLRLLVRALAAANQLDEALALADRVFIEKADPAARKQIHAELASLVPKAPKSGIAGWWERNIESLWRRRAAVLIE